MLTNIVVDVESRSSTGKNEARRLRAGGRVPGIVYGLNHPAFSVAVTPRRLEEILRLETGMNTIFKLALGGDSDQSRAVMIKDLQRDPVTERMVHVDFVRVDLTKPVRVHVPIRLLGIAAGVKTEGGIVEFVHRQVEVECLPEDIPEHLDVDVSEMHINQHAAVSILKPSEKVKILTDPEAIILVIAAPKAEETPTPAAAEAAVPAAAEPEVIKKGGKEAPGSEAEGKSKEAKPKEAKPKEKK